MNYKIIDSGSTGNAVTVEEQVLIDCGVSFKKIQEYYEKLSLVLLTHIHKDHFNKTTIKKLAKLRPTLRFGCGKWLVKELIECGVDKQNIDIYDFDGSYIYSKNLIVTNFKLIHDVPNCGYAVHINNFKYFYATDTCSLENVVAKEFDMYFIEGNYENAEELEARKQKHIERGEYYYEDRVEKTHLSQVQATEWLMKNISDKSNYVFMHQHKEKGGENGK